MNYTKMAKKIASLLKEGQKNSLRSVIIKGKGIGYYYSVSSMQFIPVPKQSEMYYLPIEPDENNNVFLFLPYTFSQGAIILVPEEELHFIGYN